MAINKAISGFIYWHATSATMTAEATTSSAGNLYQVTTAGRRILDPNVTPTLNATASGYIDKTWMDRGWDYFNGMVKLTTATSPTVTGAYLTMTTLAYVVSWGLNPNKNAAEITSLGDSWKVYTAMEEGATLTINRYYTDTETWTHLSAGAPVTVQLWEDASAGFWCKGIITSFNPTVTVGAVDTEAITIQIDGPISRC
jgi:hypothetical protein